MEEIQGGSLAAVEGPCSASYLTKPHFCLSLVRGLEVNLAFHYLPSP